MVSRANDVKVVTPLGKNTLTRMKTVVLLSSLAGLSLAGEVLCPVEEYVRVGLEFESCQKEAMVKFSQERAADPCPTIKNMARVCSSSVKVKLSLHGK